MSSELKEFFGVVFGGLFNVSPKYDSLSQDCFHKPYHALSLEDQIFIVDLFNERNE